MTITTTNPATGAVGQERTERTQPNAHAMRVTHRLRTRSRRSIPSRTTIYVTASVRFSRATLNPQSRQRREPIVPPDVRVTERIVLVNLRRHGRRPRVG